MYRKIVERSREFRQRIFCDAKAEQELQDQTLLYWLWSDFRLNGSPLSLEETRRLLEGELVPGASLQEHDRCVRCRETICRIRDLLEMQTELDLKTLNRLYVCISGGKDFEYRSNNPQLPQLNYTPPHFNEVEEEMEKLFTWIRRGTSSDNILELAAILHNGISAIYPYGEESFAMARVAVQYWLMQHELPPILWELKEQEYYEILRPYMKKKDILPMYRFLERSVFDRQEMILQKMEEMK